MKVASGTTRPMTISNVIVQGTVWASLVCTATMDKLGKLLYTISDQMNKYKGVPPLGMVDDIITVTNVDQTLHMN